MSNYSDWRSDLREVMDDEVDDKEVKEKKVNNAKLIKINPKLGEAVEELGGHIVEVSELEDKKSDKEFEDDADVKKAEQNKKKEDQLKKRIIRMKLRGLNQGSGDTLVAHNEPEGELVEASPALAANTKLQKKDDRKKKEKEYARLISILAHQKDLKKRGLGEEALDERTLSSYIPSDRQGEARRANLDYVKGQLKKKEDESTKNRGDLSKRDAGKMAKERLRNKKIRSLGEEGEALDERLGGKGYKSYTDLRGKKISGDWEDSDRGAGNKATRRSGGKVEKKSPTYKAYVLNKEEVVDEGVMKFIKDRVGGKKKPEKKASMDSTTDKLHNLRKDKFKTDRQKEHEKFVNFLDVDEEVVQEADSLSAQVARWEAGRQRRMKRSGSYERPNWIPRDQDHEDRYGSSKGEKKKSQNEEVVTELNRYGKETGKATGSLNKRPGSPVATRNQPNSAVNTVRRMIRKDTGKPEGQQKKVKGSPRGQQPGDRKLTPAQTISRMRAQVAAADAAMRDTRGT